MKLKIKIKTFGNTPVPQIIDKGDWIDLTVLHTYSTQEDKKESSTKPIMINLGIAMELPKGYEAILVARSSTFKKYGIIQANAIGIIDETFCSDADIWHFPAIALTKKINILAGSRICQFRIQLSQKATMWQKIKWLFTSGIEFVEVESLENEIRGGFGSTDN